MIKDTKHFKEILENQKVQLEADLSGIGRRDPKNPNDWEATVTDLDVLPADENDVADMFEELEGNKALINALEEQLREVDEALTKIGTDKFGICEVCDKEIEDDRMDANPSAKTCKEHMN
jgi:RNA polymerase-binding transcription factor DksA